MSRIETRDLGLAVVELGGGRSRAEDEIDHAVGLTDLPELGQRVYKGDALCVVHARSRDDAERATRQVLDSVQVFPERASGQPVVYEVIGV